MRKLLKDKKQNNTIEASNIRLPLYRYLVYDKNSLIKQELAKEVRIKLRPSDTWLKENMINIFKLKSLKNK